MEPQGEDGRAKSQWAVWSVGIISKVLAIIHPFSSFPLFSKQNKTREEKRREEMDAYSFGKRAIFHLYIISA